MPLLEVRAASCSYGQLCALDGVDLYLDRGEIVGVCGPNKAGKSTLARCIAGLGHMDGGEIIFDGADVSSATAPMRARAGIALCPEGRGVYSAMTVAENLRLGNGGRTSGEASERLDKVLVHFPVLSNRLSQRAGTLSGGEAQMLGIARKLLRNPKVLVIDEPSLGLAPVAIDRVYKALEEVRQSFGTGVLLIEEPLVRLDRRVDRAYVMHAGRVVAEGLTSELVGSASVAQAFAGEVIAVSARR